MAWVKVIGSKFKSDYRFSASLVYNTFPFPEVGEENLKKISETAEKILDARGKYSDSSLADLYNPALMPKILRDAHKKNDRAVMAAYNFDFNLTESEILSALMKLYQAKISE